MDGEPRIVTVGRPPAVTEWMRDCPAVQKIALCCQLLQLALLELGELADIGGGDKGEIDRP